MNDTDYFSWLLAFNAYRDKHPNSKFITFFSTAEGIIKIRQLIEKLYFDKLETHSINKLLKKVENNIDKENFDKYLTEIEEENIIDFVILKKLEKYKEQSYVFKNKHEGRTNILSAVEIIKERIEKNRDLEEVLDEYFQEQNKKSSLNKTKKEATENDDLSEDDLFEDFDDIDDVDEIDEINLCDED